MIPRDHIIYVSINIDDVVTKRVHSNLEKSGKDLLKVAFETHGCKLNKADSQVLSNEFAASGFIEVDTAREADVFVLNTCTVTHVADKKGRQSARAAKRSNPSAFVLVTGCYAQRDRRALEEIPEIDMVLGNEDKSSIVSKVLENLPNASDSTSDNYLLFDLPAPFMNKTVNRRMIKIQEGCDQVCSYCIVPKVRGRERSIPTQKLVTDVNHASSLGAKEVVLTGTQLGSYGFDLNDNSLSKMVKTLLDSCDIERIRISSIQPQEFTDELLFLWKDKRMCPHFHIPLQSGSNKILKSMRRRYTSEEYIEAIEGVRARVPNAAITTDVIVGYPSETDQDFRLTTEICDQVRFTDVHVFKYSARPGTTARYFDDSVPSHIKSERSRKLIDLSRKYSCEFRRENVGKEAKVLWEKTNSSILEQKKIFSGLTENYLRVYCESRADLIGSITSVLIKQYDESSNTLMVDIA